MPVKRSDAGDDAWPDELWFYDPANWPSRRAWLEAAFDFVKLHGYRGGMVIFNLMHPSNRRPEGRPWPPRPPVNELPEVCRQKLTRRIDGHR